MPYRPLLLILAAAFLLSGQSPEHKSCMAVASSQLQMNKCADEEAKRADAELDRVYQNLLAHAAKNKEAVQKIMAAQRAWIAFRDAQIESVFPAQDKQAQYGSIYPLCALEMRADLTRQRTAMLNAMLNPKGCGEVY
jgi:uncharacterized protein YecT (DUF1311 family)